MPVWVTLKSGEIRKYNTGTTWRWQYGRLAIASGEPIEKCGVADINAETIVSAEFTRPCETGWAPDFIVEHAVDLLLSRGKGLKPSKKLADLARLLRRFNPQKREWIR